MEAFAEARMKNCFPSFLPSLSLSFLPPSLPSSVTLPSLAAAMFIPALAHSLLPSLSFPTCVSYFPPPPCSFLNERRRKESIASTGQIVRVSLLQLLYRKLDAKAHMDMVFQCAKMGGRPKKIKPRFLLP